MLFKGQLEFGDQEGSPLLHPDVVDVDCGDVVIVHAPETGTGAIPYDRGVPNLEGKTAIVTGASSGIGAATVTRSAARGCGSPAGRGGATASRPTSRSSSTSPTPTAASASSPQAVEELGGLDILVNGAGLALGREPFEESTEEDERTVLETNVNGLIRITRLCLPHLRDGGHIVNMGSIAGRQAYQNGSLYITSKFAVRGFTYALREDLLGRPIRITTVDPGLVETEFSRRPLPRRRGEGAGSVYEGVDPMTPEEIADCILFALTRPPHVNIDELVVKALAQSSGGRIHREARRGADHPRRLDLLHLRRARRRRRRDERVLHRRHALPLVLRLTVNGKRPLLLSSDKVEYFSAAFYLRNPLAGGLPQDTLSIVRRRFVGEGMQERIVVRNEGMEPVSFTLALELGCDFADICPSRSTTSRSATRCTRSRCRRSSSRSTTTSRTSSSSRTPGSRRGRR